MRELTGRYFQLHEQKCGFKPSFVGASTRSLRLVLKALRERREGKNESWNLYTALVDFTEFFMTAYHNGFEQDCSIFNLNLHKDKIFKIQSNTNHDRGDV